MKNDVSVADRLLQRYLAGHDTDTGFILDVLNLTDEETVKHALAIMPGAMFERLGDFVDHYTSETKVFNGPRPNMQTVQMVRRLLGKSNGIPESKTSRAATSARRRTKANE